MMMVATLKQWNFRRLSSSLCRKLFPVILKRSGCDQITSSTSGTYHMHCVVCHVVWRNSTAVRFDKVEIAFQTMIMDISIIRDLTPCQKKGKHKAASTLELDLPAKNNSHTLSYNLSRSLADRWGTTVDFTTSFLHSSMLLKSFMK